MRRVANIIAHTLNDSAEAFPIVVVSAMSKVTDQLLRIGAHIRNGEQEAYEQELTALKRRHLDAAEKAVHNLNEQDALQQDLEAAFIALEDDVAKLRRYLDTCPPDRVSVPSPEWASPTSTALPNNAASCRRKVGELHPATQSHVYRAMHSHKHKEEPIVEYRSGVYLSG